MPERTHPFPEEIRKPISLWRKDEIMKAHPGYRMAKAGDIDAAVSLVTDLALDFLKDAVQMLPASAYYVAPHAKEASGDNALPQVIATTCALLSGGAVDNDIVQTTRVFHTGADPMERMASRPEFEGIVIPDAEYVIVDDVPTMGGTLAELAHYLQDRGGRITGAIVLVNAGRSEYFHPSSSIQSKLQSRYEQEIRQLFGIWPQALTANEANYLVGFRTVDEIRNRLLKARQETHRRLRSKGIKG
jgi:hypothetical protein